MAATQYDTLRMFTALRFVRPTWAGSLLAGAGLNDTGRALAFASLAAGAASIFVEEDPALIRSAQREGCCTFSVTSFDEALRIVKNEVRQRRAVSVALRTDSEAWLREMVERGVQPQAFASSGELSSGSVAWVQVLCERGMQTFSGFGLARLRSDSIDLEDVLSTNTGGAWSLHEQAASSLMERRAQDHRLLEESGREDAMGMITQQWLQAAPALFPRALERVYWRNDRTLQSVDS